jgi:tripartite ATP-independent transporter DctM subunit
LTAVLAIMVVSFLVLLAMQVPIAVAIAMSTFLAVLAAGGDPTYTVAMKTANGVDSFALLAIPFFIFSGVLMGRGGMASRLIRFAGALVGWFPGGLAYVNTLTCMLFGAISGSAVASVSSIGGFMIPEMNAHGYDRDFNVAVTVTAATTGMVIPPSNIMIVYAVAAGSVSIAAMFMAGVLPGILIGLCILAVCAVIGVKRGYKAGEFAGAAEVISSFIGAILSLLLIIIVIGGILAGVFTATEAAAIAVAYSFFLTVVVYREVKLRDMPGILLQVGKITAIVMLMVGTSSAMSWLLTTQNIPQDVARMLLGVSSRPMVVLIMINLLLLFVGTFMDMTPAVLIFTPIFLPVAQKLGMDPVHFGIMIIANLCIGLCTPPVGSCLFVGCTVGKTTIANVTRPMLPFFAAMVAALAAITWMPELSLWLPRALGLIK